MATVITMPRLSDTMTEGTVATWLKKVGDKVAEGDILAEIETDKATMEFESFNAGTLLYIGIPEGETAPVDSLLAIIGAEGEDVSALISPLTPKGGTETPENSTTPENIAVSDVPETSSVTTPPSGAGGLGLQNEPFRIRLFQGKYGRSKTRGGHRSLRLKYAFIF